MKRLLTLLVLAIGVTPVVQAQEMASATDSDYERMMEKRLEVNFRNYAIKSLALTASEISAFDEIFMEYMNDKDDIIDSKYSLLDKYVGSLDADKKMGGEKIADFIEDYWETEIDEMQIEKDYFDLLENELGVEKATNFFLLEDAIQNRLKNRIYANNIPLIIEIERFSVFDDSKKNKKWMKKRENTPNRKYTAQNMKLKAAVTSFIDWVRMSDPVYVGYKNEYIAKGLKALAGATLAAYEASDWEVENMKVRIENLMGIADQLAETNVATEKADIATVAFKDASSIFYDLQIQNDLGYVEIEVEEMGRLANDVFSTRLLEDQTDQIYSYFKQAASTLEQLSWDVDWGSEQKKNIDYNQR
jgi:hypothetical protein